jgi:hypothetical protein
MKIQEFDFSVDLLQALLWQYNGANRLQSLLTQKSTWYFTNHTFFWVEWYTNVFNLITANEFGLSVWSAILNLPLFIGTPPDPPGKPIFGFGGVGNTYENFGRGNFSTQGSNSFNLTVEEKRLLLRLRYWQLVSRAAIPETNNFLNTLFMDMGPVYILDGLDQYNNMFIVVVFAFPISRRLRYIIQHYDLIPRGSGVKIKYRANPVKVFGFGPKNKNFGNGTFFRET